jgi:hypothetical protein
MPQLVDARGNEFNGNLDHIVGTTVTDGRAQTVTLGALAAEATADLNGQAVAIVDARTAAGALSLVFEGTVDGVNYLAIPAFDIATSSFVATVTSATTFNKQYALTVTGFKRVRVRVSAYTSGNIAIAMRASQADFLINTAEIPVLSLSVTAAAAAAATLTLAAPGAGLRHYITGLDITRNATAALAGTATLVITTTNLPGSLAWSVGNAMLAGGTQIDVNREYVHPIQSLAQNTATTIVMPAPGAAVLWRGNVNYYIAP